MAYRCTRRASFSVPCGPACPPARLAGRPEGLRASRQQDEITDGLDDLTDSWPCRARLPGQTSNSCRGRHCPVITEASAAHCLLPTHLIRSSRSRSRLRNWRPPDLMPGPSSPPDCQATLLAVLQRPVLVRSASWWSWCSWTRVCACGFIGVSAWVGIRYDVRQRWHNNLQLQRSTGLESLCAYASMAVGGRSV